MGSKFWGLHIDAFSFLLFYSCYLDLDYLFENVLCNFLLLIYVNCFVWCFLSLPFSGSWLSHNQWPLFNLVTPFFFFCLPDYLLEEMKIQREKVLCVERKVKFKKKFKIPCICLYTHKHAHSHIGIYNK